MVAFGYLGDVQERGRICVALNQTLVPNKTFISWMLIDSDKKPAAGSPWNPGTSTLIQEGAVSTWH